MHELPELPYQYDALEPYIDERTMKIHHDKHHQGYVNKLNNALEGHEKLQQRSVKELLSNLKNLPEDIRTAVRNNGGGHYNHTLFWPSMSPDGGGRPEGDLADAIEQTFDSFDQFKKKFNSNAGGVFGSGWGWLTVTKAGDLKLVQTANQDNPVSRGLKPILGVDVWEHAYYLNYQNKRGEYLENWWNVVNWDEVEQRYNKAV